MAVSGLEDGKLTVTRERMWGQYRRPNEPVLVKLPADPQSRTKYLAKGFTFIKYGGDELPIAELDVSEEQLRKIAPIPEAVIEPEVTIVSHPVAVETQESTVTATDEPELYVSDKPYKSKKKAKRKIKPKEV
jgi:hypothetical protein